jgi:peroxiredoxin
MRWLAFIFAVVVGASLGWEIFLSPDQRSDLKPTPTATLQRSSAVSKPNIIVQVTGTPSRSLGNAVRAGSIAPDFTLADLDNKPHSLSDYRGDVVLINFWTTWCPPCLVEMPALQQAYEKYHEQGFSILGINWTEVDDRAQIRPFVQELGLIFPILLDVDSEVSEDLYQILGLPTSIYVSRDGVVQEIFIGALQLENLEARIQSLLEEKQ